MTSWEFGAASSYEEVFEILRRIPKNQIRNDIRTGAAARRRLNFNNDDEPDDVKKREINVDIDLILQDKLHPADLYFLDLYNKAKDKGGLTRSMRRSLKRKYGNLSDLALLFQFSRDRYKIQRFQAEIDYYLYRRDDIDVLS